MKLGYMTLVDDRSAETLIPIMRRSILYGSIMHTDEWAAYRCLDPQPALYGHLTVNHKTNFVNPQTGATTNHIEAYWSRAKRRFKQIYGTSLVRIHFHVLLHCQNIFPRETTANLRIGRNAPGGASTGC